mmetsp:Transcript_13415/g.42767  ORF Transcript_13415/g.42767 Transcript_13415/m.42767 type:complete len:333 (+) Transcript_13415:1012-2010(+)
MRAGREQGIALERLANSALSRASVPRCGSRIIACADRWCWSTSGATWFSLISETSGPKITPPSQCQKQLCVSVKLGPRLRPAPQPVRCKGASGGGKKKGAAGSVEWGSDDLLFLLLLHDFLDQVRVAQIHQGDVRGIRRRARGHERRERCGGRRRRGGIRERWRRAGHRESGWRGAGVDLVKVAGGRGHCRRRADLERVQRDGGRGRSRRSAAARRLRRLGKGWRQAAPLVLVLQALLDDLALDFVKLRPMVGNELDRVVHQHACVVGDLVVLSVEVAGVLLDEPDVLHVLLGGCVQQLLDVLANLVKPHRLLDDLVIVGKLLAVHRLAEEG